MSREWWFEEDVDEIMPPGRQAPEDWFVVNEAGEIRRVPAEENGAAAPDAQLYQVGDTVQMHCVDALGQARVTFHRDGSYLCDGGAPAGYNLVNVLSDGERQAESLEQLAGFEADMWLGSGDEQTEEVEFWSWSEPVTFTIAGVKDGRVLLDGQHPQLHAPLPAMPRTPDLFAGGIH